MIGLLASLAVVFLGIIIKSGLLIGFGFVALALQLVLDSFKKKEVKPVAGGSPKYRHKLIDAPEDMWKNPEDDIWPAMMSGPSPMSIGGQPDFLGNAALSNFNDPHVSGMLRNMLPFPNYGREGPMGAVENIFFGLPIGIGNFIRR